MFGNKSGPSKVFEYGCLPPIAEAGQVDDQMRKAHVYRNKLTEMELARRQEWRRVISGDERVALLEAEEAHLDGLLAQARDEISRARQQARGTTDTSEPNQQCKDLQTALREVWKHLKTMRREVQNDPVIKDRLHKINADAQAAVKVARSESGLYWGNYLVVEQAADQARKSSTDPRFRRFDGSGRLAVQLQRGLAVEDVFGKDTRLQIDPVAEAAWTSLLRGERRRLSRTKVRFRVGSDGRLPLWAEFPIIMHRPLPTGGRIKWAYVIRRRVATKFEYKFQVVVELPEMLTARPANRDAVGIDVGWRQVKEGLRVAYWADEQGNHDQLVLTEADLYGFRKADELRSVRDEQFNTARTDLAEWLKAADVPEWFRERTATLAQWRSANRLASLVVAWRGERFAGDDTAFSKAEAWRKQDKHLYEWGENLRDQTVRRRREIYRVFAARLAERYSFVILEHFDLRQMARTPLPEEGVADNHSARHARVLAAVSVLRQAVEQACTSRGVRLIKVPAEYTTKQCHTCRHVDNFDAAKWVMHRCSQCGALWDQDENAAKNLLRAGVGLPDEAAD